jgi:hypothetical protein
VTDLTKKLADRLADWNKMCSVKENVLIDNKKLYAGRLCLHKPGSNK